MPNIKFSYRYRHACNYKNFGLVIFANPTNINTTEIETLIHQKLIDGTNFYAGQWNLPNLFFPDCNLEIELTWHEFESIEPTTEPPNSQTTLSEFIELINKTKPIY